MEKIANSITRLKAEMEGISQEQRSIREGQRQLRIKFEQVEQECKQLREETEAITMQSKTTQLRLALMFQIIKAREDNDFPRAIQLTRYFRELIGNKNVQIKPSEVAV